MAQKRKQKAPVLAISVPKGWGELTSNQVARVGEVLVSDPHPNGTWGLLLLATEFAGLKPRGSGVNEAGEVVYRYYHRTTGNVWLTSEQVAHIVEAMRWMTSTEVEPMAAPQLDGYRVPDDRMMDLTLEQFVTADNAYGVYVHTKNPIALRTMVAAVYAREVYDPERLESDVVRIGRCDRQLYAVFLWFTGAKVHLTRKFPKVFGGEGEGEVPDGVSYLLGLLSSLNGGDVTKNELIKTTNLYEALSELEHKIENENRKNA